MPEPKEGTCELLFGVHPEKGNLFSAKVVKMRGGKVMEWKKGVGTSLGHALNIVEDIMGAYVIQAIEQKPEEFYDDIQVI